jgi:phosphohistidine phosphatase
MVSEKRLTLLRHGEAAVAVGQSGDFKRKLSDQGRAQLTRLHGMVLSEGLTFDHAVYSPAIRCVESLRIINSTDNIPSTEKLAAIYNASLLQLLAVVNSLNDDFADVLVVGHNPGISHLVGFLTGDASIVFTPGMMVRMSFAIDRWTLISRQSGSIVEVLQ